MEKDGESEAGSTKNLIRNVQAMASYSPVWKYQHRHVLHP